MSLSLTVDVVKNPSFLIAIPDEDSLEALLSESSLKFAPGLIDVVDSALPPTIIWFKDLPSLTKISSLRWAVYLLVLEKDGCRFKIYIGSGTNSVTGVKARLYCYDSETLLPQYVEEALEDGYKITHKGLLCWSPIPLAGSRYAVVALFLAHEATFSILLAAMKFHTRDYGMPHICLWDVDTLEYDGLCSHTALAEGIRGEMDHLTPEQIAVKEVAIEQRRIAQYRTRNMANYYRLKAEDFPKWQAQRRGQAERFDPVSKAAIKKRADEKAKALRKYVCNPCGNVYSCSKDLERHKQTKKHISKVTGVDRVYKDQVHRKYTDRNIAAKRFYCAVCKYAAHNQSILNKHLLTKIHIKKAAALEKSKKTDAVEEAPPDL